MANEREYCGICNLSPASPFDRRVMPITCSPIDEAPPTTLTAPSKPFVKDLSTDFLARIPNQQFEAQYEARVILDALPLSFLCRELELPDTLYHRTLACLPLPLALLLHEQPQFVSPITRAFIHGVGEVFGNDEDIKRNTPYHIPKQTGQSLPSIGNPSSPFSASLRVMSNVRFTRCLFAMLQFRTVETPHRWVRCAKLASTGNGVDEIGLQHAVDIGTKLTIGAELLRAEWVRRGKPRDAKSPQPAVQSDAPERMLVDEGNEMPGLRGSGESMNPNDILRERIDSLNTKYSLTHSDHPSPRALSLNESLHLLTTYLDQIQQAQLSQQVVLVRPDDTTAPSPGFTSQSEHVPLDVAFFPRDGLVRRLSGIDGWEVVGGESEEWMYLSQEKVDEMIAEEGLGNTSKQNDQKSRDRETITQSAMQKEESNLNELPAASHPSNLMSNLDSFLSAQSSFEGVDSPTSTEQSHKPPKPSRSAVEGVFSSMDESDRRAVLAWMADGDDDEDDETVQFDQLEREITRFVRDTTDMKDWVRNGAGVQTEGENESSSEMLSDDDSDDSDGSGEDDDEIVQTRQEMEKLMQEMEKELTLGMNQNENDADFDVTSLENLVEKNLKRSLKEQGASAGPARTLLNSMGRRK
ncbi:hypothetical protein BLNAU_289 [Blattamonas nauphoetae]|uniref:Uncharacterized protein n=1 Tax=Blattamonas nauphoetae TaxID=2049346 RepID=A0ABQ9YML4_9EUKA|nr:hypothetical protein BLNAU_289 [Blattamonas nauphoetae]